MGTARIDLGQTKGTTFPYTAEIGQAALMWNSTHGVVFAFFVGFTGLRAKHAVAAFYSLKADSAQRDMTRDLGVSILSEMTHGDSALLLSRYKDLMKRIGRYAGHRNALIHAHIGTDKRGFVTVDYYNPPQPNSPRKEAFNDLDKTLEEISKLLIDAADLFNEISAHLSWPEKLLEL